MTLTEDFLQPYSPKQNGAALRVKRKLGDNEGHTTEKNEISKGKPEEKPHENSVRQTDSLTYH